MAKQSAAADRTTVVVAGSRTPRLPAPQKPPEPLIPLLRAVTLSAFLARPELSELILPRLCFPLRGLAHRDARGKLGRLRDSLSQT